LGRGPTQKGVFFSSLHLNKNEKTLKKLKKHIFQLNFFVHKKKTEKKCRQLMRIREKKYIFEQIKNLP
jgi:hypothetical protein